MSVHAVVPASLYRGRDDIFLVSVDALGADVSLVIAKRTLPLKRLSPPGAPIALYEVAMPADLATSSTTFSFVVGGVSKADGKLGIIDAPTKPGVVVAAWGERTAEQITCGSNVGKGLLDRALGELAKGRPATEIRGGLQNDLTGLASAMGESLMERQRPKTDALINAIGGGDDELRAVRRKAKSARETNRENLLALVDQFESTAGL